MYLLFLLRYILPPMHNMYAKGMAWMMGNFMPCSICAPYTLGLVSSFLKIWSITNQIKTKLRNELRHLRWSYPWDGSPRQPWISWSRPRGCKIRIWFGHDLTNFLPFLPPSRFAMTNLDLFTFYRVTRWSFRKVPNFVGLFFYYWNLEGLRLKLATSMTSCALV